MQLSLFDAECPIEYSHKHRRSGAFSDNMKMPLHRWFRYSAGFSADWVENTIASKEYPPKKILDPFCGSGTTLIEARKFGTDVVGFEPHPFIFKVAQCKINWDIDIQQFYAISENILNIARKIKKEIPIHPSALIQRCYTGENLARLESLRNAWLEVSGNGMPENIKNLTWLAITCILRECSGVGTAQWQYLLPNKKKAKISDPYLAFQARIQMFCSDLTEMRKFPQGAITLLQTDARHPDCTEKFDLIITSPPYPNNYDYADATRLEMVFWEEITSWGDLHDAVRCHLLRSCSQHSAKERLQLELLLQDTAIASIRHELQEVCRELDAVRQNKGGKKTYHTMVAAYFIDLANVFLSLQKLTTENAELIFMIGDSAPYGVYVPVDEWLGKLALAAGFGQFHFEKIRSRNDKWKNRKHTVPLKEGILHIKR